MSFEDLKIMMFAFHNNDISRLEMICAIHLWQRKDGHCPETSIHKVLMNGQ